MFIVFKKLVFRADGKIAKTVRRLALRRIENDERPAKLDVPFRRNAQRDIGGYLRVACATAIWRDNARYGREREFISNEWIVGRECRGEKSCAREAVTVGPASRAEFACGANEQINQIQMFHFDYLKVAATPRLCAAVAEFVMREDYYRAHARGSRTKRELTEE